MDASNSDTESAIENEPLISILLPVYNGEKFLESAVRSALDQSMADFELLIADDGSTDDSVAISKSLASQDPRIKFWQNEKNLGLFENYNACLRKARGNFIKPFAQDDILLPGCLEKMLETLQNNEDVSIVTCAKHWIDPDGSRIRELRQFSEDRKIKGKEVILYNLLRLTNWVGEPSTAMFKKEYAGSGFDTGFFHYGDLDYWFSIMDSSYYIYMSEVLCAFRRHPGAQTNKNLKGLLFALDILRLGKKYRHILDEFGETPEQYHKRAIEIIALNLEHQIKEENLHLDEILAIGAGKASCAPELYNDPEQRIEDLEKVLAGFKEITFHSLTYLSETLSQLDHAKRTRVAELDIWQKEMSKLLESPSWKATAPFRAIKALLRPPERK